VVPGWPDDVTLEAGEPVAPVDAAPVDPGPPRPAESVAEDLAHRPAWAADTSAHPARYSPIPIGVDDVRADDEPVEDDGSDDARSVGGNGAFGTGSPGRFGALDPGRRGVKALAAVAVVVVLVAALLAWRARPRVDPVAAPGIDPAAVDSSLAGADPAVAGPSASGAAGVVVAVGGKVRRPGLVELPPGARVADALRAAGGADPGVDVAPLNLARKLTDGELIMVGATLPPGAAAPAPAANPAPGQPGAGPINLNTATLADLDTLPGVGPVLAQRIMAARDAQGGFKAVTDLRQVEGIGSARYEQLKDLVTV